MARRKEVGSMVATGPNEYMMQWAYIDEDERIDGAAEGVQESELLRIGIDNGLEWDELPVLGGMPVELYRRTT